MIFTKFILRLLVLAVFGCLVVFGLAPLISSWFQMTLGVMVIIVAAVAITLTLFRLDSN